MYNETVPQQDLRISPSNQSILSLKLNRVCPDEIALENDQTSNTCNVQCNN